MQAGMLKQQLLKKFDEAAMELGLEVTLGAHRLMQKMINQGIQRMTTMGVLERPDKVMLAEQNIKAFAEALGQAASQEKTKSVIGERAFDRAKAAHCPLWPIC